MCVCLGSLARAPACSNAAVLAAVLPVPAAAAVLPAPAAAVTVPVAAAAAFCAAAALPISAAAARRAFSSSLFPRPSPSAVALLWWFAVSGPLLSACATFGDWFVLRSHACAHVFVCVCVCACACTSVCACARAFLCVRAAARPSKACQSLRDSNPRWGNPIDTRAFERSSSGPSGSYIARGRLCLII